MKIGKCAHCAIRCNCNGNHEFTCIAKEMVYYVEDKGKFEELYKDKEEQDVK